MKKHSIPTASKPQTKIRIAEPSRAARQAEGRG